MEALEYHHGTVNVGGRTISNLRFADGIDGLAGEEEPAKLVEHLNKASTAYGMEIIAEKKKVYNKQHQRYEQRGQSQWMEASDSHKLQVPGLSCIWQGFQARETLQDSTDDSSINKVEPNFERQQHFSQFRDTIDVPSCHIHPYGCL